MPGFSTITGDESIVWADNLSFDGTERSGKLTTDGELLIGSTVAPHIRKGSLVSSDGTVTITSGAGTIDLKAGASVPTTFTAEDASTCSPIANVLNIVGTTGGGINTSAAGNTLTISLVNGGFIWTDATSATYNLASQNGYITNRGGGVAYTLPASGALGDTIKIIGKTGLATIAQNANQQIFIGNTNTTLGVGGSLVATNAGDCVTIVCITAGASTAFRVESVIGNWTVN